MEQVQPQVKHEIHRQDNIAGPTILVNESGGNDMRVEIEKPDLSLAEKLMKHQFLKEK